MPDRSVRSVQSDLLDCISSLHSLPKTITSLERTIMAITLQGTIRADKYDHAILEALNGIRASVRSGCVPNKGICFMLENVPARGRVVQVRTRAAYDNGRRIPATQCSLSRLYESLMNAGSS